MNPLSDEWLADIFSHSVWVLCCCWGFLLVLATDTEVYLQHRAAPPVWSWPPLCSLSGGAFEVYCPQSGFALISCALESYPGTSHACANVLKYVLHVFSQKFQIFRFPIWALDTFWLTAVQSEELGWSFCLQLEDAQCPQCHFFFLQSVDWTCVPKPVWDRILPCWSRCLYVHAMLFYWLWLCKMSWNQVLWGRQHLAGFYSRMLCLFGIVSVSTWILGSVLTLSWGWRWPYRSHCILCNLIMLMM